MPQVFMGRVHVKLEMSHVLHKHGRHAVEARSGVFIWHSDRQAFIKASVDLPCINVYE